MQHTPLVPWWIAMPFGAVVLLLLARYLLGLGAAEMDERRRRVRTANTILMMLVTPRVAYGVGVAPPARARASVCVWVLICSLLFMVILLAVLDMLNSLRLHRVHMRNLRRSMREGGPGAAVESPGPGSHEVS